MISLKSKREIEIIRDASEILKKVFSVLRPAVVPGVTTRDLDEIAEGIIAKSGARPAFKGYRGFPCTACISINEEVVHGIPGPRKLKEGDLVSVDVGVERNGYYSDAARSWVVGTGDKKVTRLIETAQRAFSAGTQKISPGNRIGDLSEAIQRIVENEGYQVVREFVGHGIGKALHEDPQVPNYGKSGHGPKIEVGLVLAVEPMVTEKHYAVETAPDGWTVRTRDRGLAAHYEDTVSLTEAGLENLTGEI